MLLQPSDSWKWWFDDHHDKLMIDLNDHLTFATAYLGKDLVSAAKEKQPFSIDDARLYISILDAIPTSLSIPHRVQIALNSVAVVRFYKPLMPQSWFFQKQIGGMSVLPDYGQVVQLKATDDCTVVELIVVEPQDPASICMALEQTTLCETKVLAPFDVIKVMNNRFIPNQNETFPTLKWGSAG